MPAQDTSVIKEKIVSILRRNGPSLPVHIAKGVDSSILFTSAFLSELVSEKRIKMSYLRIGSSPLYLISGQEPLLEKFSHYLKSKEKEAFLILKEKEFLKDSEQDAPIRVALREIKDFAIPFKKQEIEELFWRFFTIPERKTEEESSKKEEPEEIAPKKDPKKNQAEEQKEESKKSESEKTPETEQEKVSRERREKDLGIFDQPSKPQKRIKKPLRKKTSQKESNFFNKIKEFLSEKSIELTDIITFNKNEIVLKVREGEKEGILVAYNKNRINEVDIIKASKKSREFNIPYIIISKGGILKRTEELIEAIKNMHSIGKLKEDNV